MDTSSRAFEHCREWLLGNFTSDAKWQENLPSRIGASELYAPYSNHCQYHGEDVLLIEDFWKVMQSVWPWVKVIGEKGARRFTCLRRKNGSPVWSGR